MIIASTVRRSVLWSLHLLHAVQLLALIFLVAVSPPVLAVSNGCSVVSLTSGLLVTDAEARFETPSPVVVRVLSDIEGRKQFITAFYKGRCMTLDELGLASGYRVTIHDLQVDGHAVIAVVYGGERTDFDANTSVHIFDVIHAQSVGVLNSVGDPIFGDDSGAHARRITTFSNRFLLEAGPLWPDVHILRVAVNVAVIEPAPSGLICDALMDSLSASRKYANTFDKDELRSSEWVEGEVGRVDQQMHALEKELSKCSLPQSR
jgi:hypothetical protein